MRRLVPFVLVASVGVAVACSSFSDDSAPAGDDAGTADVSAPVADAGDLDANPCRFGNGKHDGSFCDDFDDPTDLSNRWLGIVAPDGGGIGHMTDDAAASPPNVMAAFLPAHAGATQSMAIVPIEGATKVDCSFSIKPIAVAPDDYLDLMYVEILDIPPTRRAFALGLRADRGVTVSQALYADGGLEESEAGVEQTAASFAPAWSRVRLSLEKDKPVTLDINDGLYTFKGPVPGAVKLKGIVLGVASKALDAGTAGVLYDDVVCTYE